MQWQSNAPIYIGVDPGANGALAAIQGDLVAVQRMDEPAIMWAWLAGFMVHTTYTVIEEQTARPVQWDDKETGQHHSTVLKSTVDLFGNYRALETMLMCAGFNREICPPKRWQTGIGVHRAKETYSQRKNRFKTIAQGLFPTVKVTLGNADALLIATYCRTYYKTG